MDVPTADDVRAATRQRPAGTVIDVELDRPEARNALRPSTIEALTSTVASIEEPDGDVVVLAGAGEDFCAGADVGALAESEVDETVAAIVSLQDLVRAVRTAPLPVVAKVDGNAYGAGFLLAMAADVVVAAERASFGVQEVRLDLPVAGFATTLLPRLVGERRAREWLLLGETVGAATAAEAGFVTRVVPAADLDEAVGDYVETLAANGAVGLAETKRLLAASADLGDGEAERAAVRRALEEGEALARLRAALER